LSNHRNAGYTPKHAEKLNTIAELVVSKPDIKVKIVEGFDTICFACPGYKGPAKCKSKVVNFLDSEVTKLLGLKPNGLYNYHDMVKQLRKVLTLEKHEELCSSCHWWDLCKNIFKKSKLYL
jgi:hypothetical protein